MAQKKYYWLKFTRDFFKRHDIRIIEKMPHGKEFALFYIKLMLESIDHEGTLRYSEELPYDYEMLAAVTDTEEDIVEKALDVFVNKFKIVKILEDGTIFIPAVQQLIGSTVENDNANRQRRFRERKKQEALQNITDCNVTSVTPVTDSNVTSVTKNNESKRIDKEIEIDIELDIEKEKERKISCEQVADLFKTLCPSLPSLKIISKSIKADLEESITKYNLDEFKLLFKKAEASNFLKGENERKWVASFDWLIKADNIAKVLNGKFDSKQDYTATYSMELFKQLLNASDEEKEPETTELSPEYKARVEALKNDLQKN